MLEIVDIKALEEYEKMLNGKLLEPKNGNTYVFKVIPYYSLGNQNGIMIGFEPDYIKVYDEEICVRRDVVIGICNEKLSKSNLYTSIIGINIF